MTEHDDPWLIDAIWRAVDLKRAYLIPDRVQVAACLAGLDSSRLERVLTWLVLDHDILFCDLGEPSMSVRELDSVAALAPLETELAMMTAVRRVAAKETGLTGAVEGLALLDRVHAIAICTAVMLLEARGRTAALVWLDGETVRYEQMGYPRPYTNT
ncbi:hypothetical protein ACFRI7_11775 [Streptomyces sp. NPDC056716]|uniref:hypothetical protein n=1 Tax=unclassified Streptomyces TaxID=2593676 RepID=UPI0036BF58FC